MKKNLLLTLLAVGITVSAFGVYYLHKNNYFAGNNQTSENNLGKTSESSEEPKPEKPGEAYEWRLLAWRDENGYIPPNGLSEAIRQRDLYLRLQTREQTQLRKQQQITPQAVARLNWVSRGPKNVGGRTRSLIIHPDYPDIIWAGSVSGGVWKTTDGGTSWFAINGNLQNYAIGSMAMHPTNRNILFVGTGEGFLYSDSLRGAGIFKTPDGGMTWTQIPATADWHSVNRISIDPNDGNNMLAATSGGVRRSTNGGNSWSLVYTITPSPSTITSLYVAFDPNNSSKAVAEIFVDPSEEDDNDEYHQVIYSTNGGATWTNSMRDGSVFQLSGKNNRVELAYAPSSPNMVYALFPGKIARSTDGGQTFTDRPSSSLSSSSGGISIGFNTLWVAPNDSNFVVAGGFYHVKSTNGGDSFTRISEGLIMTVQPHVDQHCIVPDPGYNGGGNKRVYVCNDGGVYRTDDITTASTSGGWERKDSTYQTSQYYGVAGLASTGRIYGGTQDNGTLKVVLGNPNATLVSFSGGGDGGFSAIDPIETNFCYGEQPNLKIHRSDNCNLGSPPAATIFQGITDAGDDERTNFIAPFILDPNAPQKMLAGGRSLWRTTNVREFSPIWTSIRPGGPDKTDNISAIAVATGYSNIIWIGQNNGKIYKTTNGTADSPNWTPIDDNDGTNPLPGRVATRILIDKDNSDVVYISFGGFEGDNLWRTNNGGATWTDITGAGLPSVPIRGIARHPNNASKLYLGTEIGVFTTDNGGTTWDAVLDGPANVSVDEVVFMIGNSTTLLAATHGRGIWSTDVGDTTITDHALFDFDADGRSDLSVFRPSDTKWYVQRSILPPLEEQFGVATDKPVARDYDGDGKADIAVWRASDATWHRLNSSNGAYVVVQFGQNGDVPLPADFDDDGKADQAVFRPSTGVWHLNQSTAGYSSVSWGVSTDIPSAADFDGDDKADLAVFRPSTGVWYLRQSTSGDQYVYFGQNGDIPVPADYDGDGKADTAVFRSGTWYLNRTTAGVQIIQYGVSSDKLVPADYDGDGKADIAVWRPTDGTWYLLQSANGQRIVWFGLNGDVPIPAVP